MILLFKAPADIEAFEAVFAAQHVPAITGIPGLVRATVTRGIAGPRGPAPFHLIHELYFETLDGMRQALESPAGRAAGATLMAIARDCVEIMFAETWE
ncbi:MAG: EthD family reductase [Thermoflexales bacterium]|nr:EthD family reductase [Thermoflexales bacterium]